MEKRVLPFIPKLQKNSSDPEISNIFQVMADEETKHVKFLSDQFVHYEKKHKFAQVKLLDLKMKSLQTLSSVRI